MGYDQIFFLPLGRGGGGEDGGGGDGGDGRISGPGPAPSPHMQGVAKPCGQTPHSDMKYARTYIQNVP